MLLTITNTGAPATDLGYLLHKHPAKAQTFSLNFGSAHVYYPEVSDERCTAALLLEIDPVALVRGKRRETFGGGLLDQYVNDRPYVASSFLSVALSEVYRSAMAGRCNDRPEAVERPLPLQATITALPSRGGEALIRRLFEPLGYQVEAEGHELDALYPEWGTSPYYTVTLTSTIRLHDLLKHLYVLIPVLDDDKHYWVGDDEVEKLLRNGAEWLPAHPEKSMIARRYLKHYHRLTRDALARLVSDQEIDPDREEAEHDAEEEKVEMPISLNEQRLGSVMAVLRNLNARRVVDLGCGEGKLIMELVKEPGVAEILGMDVTIRALERAKDRLEKIHPAKRARIKLIHGSLTYRDKRLEGYDAATLVEVIEHLDTPRLSALESVVFGHARPGAVIVTTPNAEYNVKWESLPAGTMRHRDHRFEWTRDEFRRWAAGVAERHGYTARFLPIGPDDPVVGSPTQMGIFEKTEAGSSTEPTDTNDTTTTPPRQGADTQS